MAYVEFVGNSLPPLPRLPVVKDGRWILYGRDDYDDAGNEITEKSDVVQSQ